MGFMSFLTGSSPKMRQVNRFTGPQMSALSTLLGQGMADTNVEGLEKKYRGMFERDTVPALAERFTAMGGGQRSSAFEESLRRGGLELSEQLANLRHSSGMQKLGFGLQPQFDTVMEPGKPGLLSQIAGPILGSVLGGGLGGLMGGGGIGRGIGSALSGAFGGGGGGQQQAMPQMISGGQGYMPQFGGQQQQAGGGVGQAGGGVLDKLLGSGLGGILGGGRGKADDQQAYLKGQPRGLKRGFNPVLLKILEGIQL